MEDVKTLQKKRDSLNAKIRDYVLKNKNAYEFVIEHVELTAQLQACGRNVKSVADYLLLENWESGGKYFHLRGSGNQPKYTKPSKPQITKASEPKEEPTPVLQKDIYTLCLGWVATDKEEPEQIKKVKGYFSELSLPLIDQNINETQQGVVEHILKYEFAGSDDSFRLLKICTQFVLDSFAQSDFDKFNIAVWGKKMRK